MGVLTKADVDFLQFRGPRPFTLNVPRLVEVYWSAGTALANNIGEVRELIRREMAAGRTIIGEFGQAYWLDKRHGFSPNVTASHTYTPEFFESAGIPVQPIHTFGVAKAYDTKVGTHTFITQMNDAHPLAAKLKELEFGTSTGRQRMVGWYDAVEKGDALRYGGFQDLMINKLDALTWSAGWRGPVHICTAYADPAGKPVPPCAAQRGRAQDVASDFRGLPRLERGRLAGAALCRSAAQRAALRRRDDEGGARGGLCRRILAGPAAQPPLPGRRSQPFPGDQGRAADRRAGEDRLGELPGGRRSIRKSRASSILKAAAAARENWCPRGRKPAGGQGAQAWPRQKPVPTAGPEFEALLI